MFGMLTLVSMMNNNHSILDKYKIEKKEDKKKKSKAVFFLFNKALKYHMVFEFATKIETTTDTNYVVVQYGYIGVSANKPKNLKAKCMKTLKELGLFYMNDLKEMPSLFDKDTNGNIIPFNITNTTIV